MVRTVLFMALSALGASQFPLVSAQDAREPTKENPRVSLRVGDVAPALKVTRWLQGEEVRKFEPGKVYVVEFWATWCGPCIAFMPHLAQLQARYKDQGVTCIGYTGRDPDNTEEKVVAFVKKRGPKLAYTFAYADDQTTIDGWMKAAGRDAIPCAFVVDKTGRIAYIGDPMFLGVVLPRVLAGDRTAQAVSKEVGRIQQEFRAVNEALFPDNKAGLRALKQFEARYPPMANTLYSVKIKLSLLPKVGELDEAKKVAEAAVAKALDGHDPSGLRQVAALLRNGPGKESKELLAVAVKAAEAAVRVAGDQDARVLIDLAETYFVAGDKARAREYARKARDAAVGEPTALKRSIEEVARKLGDQTRDEKK
jgi:thiol-disulfide isomerase/thioredoxin